MTDTISPPNPQPCLDNFSEYIWDAVALYAFAEERFASTGGSSKESKALYRAALVASVGALEAYTEELAVLIARHLGPLSEKEANKLRSGLTSPTRRKVEKVYAPLLGHDPTQAIRVRIRKYQTRVNEASVASGKDVDLGKVWREMTAIRHSVAHLDAIPDTDDPDKKVEIILRYETDQKKEVTLGKLSAWNAISLAVQIAVLLAAEVNEGGHTLRWPASWSKDKGLARFLSDTYAGEEVARWRNGPTDLGLSNR